jgi:hypothetical protein
MKNAKQKEEATEQHNAHEETVRKTMEIMKKLQIGKMKIPWQV